MSRPKLLGLLLLLGSALLALGSVILIYSSYERWSGISHLNAANAMLLAGQSESSQRESQAAAACLPDEAAAVLPTIDLTSSEAEGRLARLASHCPHDQLAVVTTTQALYQVLHNQPPPTLDGGDGVLLGLISQLRSGTAAAALPDMKQLGATHLSVLEAFFLQQWLVAFAGKQWDLAREAAGTLWLLMPTHADASMLAVCSVVLASDFDVERLRHVFKAGPDHARQLQFAQQLASIVPEHAEPLMSCVLGLSTSASAAQRLQAELSAIGDQGLSAPWVLQDCLRANRSDLAAKVIDRLPESQRQREQNRITNLNGDVGTLAVLGGSDPTLAPHCSVPFGHAHIISFALSNEQGMLPQTHVTISINGVAVPAADIHCVGPIFGVHSARTGDITVDIHGGDQVLYSGKITL
jgi:hypothetical protein